MKGTLLVKNVKHLVTCDANDRLLDGVDVFVRDGVIESIGHVEGTGIRNTGIRNSGGCD